MIEIRCKNTGTVAKCEAGTTLKDIYFQMGVKTTLPPVAAKVNNVLMGMDYQVYMNKTVEFVDITSSLGLRIYTRTLFFILCKAVYELYPEGKVRIEFPVSNGYYCRLMKGTPVTPDDVYALRDKMNGIIASETPIILHQRPSEEVIEMFKELHNDSKVSLLETLGRMYSFYSSIGDYKNSFYGPTLTNTREVTNYGLEMYHDGLLLRCPKSEDPTKLGDYIIQNKMFDLFDEYHRWQDTIHISTVGTLNKVIMHNKSKILIQVFEALQEKKLARIADEIANRRGVKVVLIAGPSSSGKTTTCKRLSIQLITNGIRPVGISLDDYFLDRENTPKDENGEYDFESLYALNLPLFNEQLDALINGNEVELPHYNFVTGKSEKSGKKLKLQPNEVLVIEGIHALNPELTQKIPDHQLFRVYASALTTITMDDHNYIPTTDNRLLRRIIRDYKYRNNSAQQTLKRWSSVRAGEEKWIFPFQENADVMFNTAMLFEFAVIKTQAEPLLEQVPENCEEYTEAHRLLHFLKYVKPIPESQIPPTSLLREFLGGSMFEY